ncbi:intraflagellar transport protein 88 homolog [Lucilia cuprina]|uniref:intraflagellar transport protein 88 homolog n=1 Tax=Lucilia cuprina TaxID=7375 RepID=UPI001F055885|nr:intraflagellar transport protein 88 homolog [Lucilia cuprina]XP_046806456.1 intraflagellar transport protein 88 homolog [Lucilia cuprina]
MSAEISKDASGNSSSTAVSNRNQAPPPPPTAAGRPPTSLLFSRGNLVSSRLGGDKTALARPSTAVRAVGYAANNSGSAGQRFDQFFVEKARQQTLSSANAAIVATKEVSPQIKYKNLEAKIVKLLESSIVIAAKATNSQKLGISSTDGSREESSSADHKATLAESLNKAKEAFSLDRTLHRFRDQHGENIFHNFDLTYAVFFNLAEQYERNDMHIEALNTYSIMTKNKMFPHVNQLKLNMGNIYYRMGIYPKAIKMYRMALDSVPNNLKQLRLKITQNIGILFVRMGQYADAAASFEFIMSERADIRSGIHLILCYYAMGDVDKIKSTFRNLCDVLPMEAEKDLDNENSILKLQQHVVSEQQHHTQTHPQRQLQHQDEFEHSPTAEIEVINSGNGSSIGSVGGAAGNSFDLNENTNIGSENAAVDGVGNGGALSATNEQRPKTGTRPVDRNSYILQSLKSDELAIYFKQRKNSEKRAITMIVDLISPIIEENYNDGYNWCIEVIKTSNLSWLASELELNKALVYLRQNDVNQAIETLQMYDRKSEGSMTASALTNLTFIYINLGNLEMASHCVQQMNEIGALQTNAMALVNASIIDYQKQNYTAARNKLERALQIQPDNFEANYNLGLVAMAENDYALAEEQFENLKTQLMVPHSVQHSHVYYQLAKLQEKINTTTIGGGNFKLANTSTALQSYLQVLGISAGEIDSHLFEKVGSIYEQLNDHQEANQYYNEAYRINPSDINIASSIGSYYIKLQAIEKALYYYERAVLADPQDPNLMLRIASCFRNSYLPPKQYLGMFEKIYTMFPDNLNCVRALVQVTKSLGMSELNEKYSLEYARLHKAQMERENEQRYQQQRLSSAASGRLGSSRLRAFRNQNESSFTGRLPESSAHSVVSNAITANFNGDHYVRTTDTSFSAHHTDPLGPPAERPRTGMIKHDLSQDSDDEEINAESLLPI